MVDTSLQPDDDLTRIDGEGDQLIGQLEKKYGRTLEEAQKEVAAFKKKCGCE